MSTSKHTNNREVQQHLYGSDDTLCPFQEARWCDGPPVENCWKCKVMYRGVSLLQTCIQTIILLRGLELCIPLRHAGCVPELPPVAPEIRIEKSLEKPLHVVEGDYRAISLRDVLTPGGFLRFAGRKQLLDALKLPLGTPLILNCSKEEYLIEIMWSSLRHVLLEGIRQLGFNAVLPPNYSQCGGDARCVQIAAQCKSAFVFSLMMEAGMNCIPYMDVMSSERDIQRVVNWFRQMPYVNAGYLSTQLLKNEEYTFQEMIRNTRKILKRVGRRLHIVWVGPSTSIRIRKVFRAFPNSTIVSAKPFWAGRNGELLDTISLKRVKSQSSSLADIVDNNIERWQRCAELEQTCSIMGRLKSVGSYKSPMKDPSIYDHIYRQN